GMLAHERSHEAVRALREVPGRVLVAVVARALPAPHEGVERGEEIERDQQRTALEELAVVDAPLRRQRVLELPRQADARVVVRAAGPARARPAGHGLPQTRHTLGEAVEGGAE